MTWVRVRGFGGESGESPGAVNLDQIEKLLVQENGGTPGEWLVTVHFRDTAYNTPPNTYLDAGWSSAAAAEQAIYSLVDAVDPAEYEGGGPI